MKDIVIFDLDGTLANIQHRRPLVESEPKQWREFYAACPADTVNEAVAAALFAYRNFEYEIWIVSGRSNEVQAETDAWLREHGLTPDELLMREARDHQPDHKLKQSWLRSGIIPKERVLCVYDDRSSVVAMWRATASPASK